MHQLCIFLLGLIIAFSEASRFSRVVHYTIERRGGRFPVNPIANMTFLTEQLQAAEARFNKTRREMHGNKVVRRPKDNDMNKVDLGKLIGEVGRDGAWYVGLYFCPVQVRRSSDG